MDISQIGRDNDDFLEPNFGIGITELVKKKHIKDKSVDSSKTKTSCYEQGRSVHGRSVMEREDYRSKMTRSDYNILKQ